MVVVTEKQVRYIQADRSKVNTDSIYFRCFRKLHKLLCTYV